MTIFDEATPLLSDIGDRLIDQRLPVVAYVAAVLLETALKGSPKGRPAIMDTVLADVHAMIEFIVAC